MKDLTFSYKEHPAESTKTREYDTIMDFLDEMQDPAKALPPNTRIVRWILFENPFNQGEDCTVEWLTDHLHAILGEERKQAETPEQKPVIPDIVKALRCIASDKDGDCYMDSYNCLMRKEGQPRMYCTVKLFEEDKIQCPHYQGTYPTCMQDGECSEWLEMAADLLEKAYPCKNSAITDIATENMQNTSPTETARADGAPLRKGDIVVRNNRYDIPAKDRDVKFTVCTDEQNICGTRVVWLEGRPSCYAVDGLTLIHRAADTQKEPVKEN